jgi:hypothetical protein
MGGVSCRACPPPGLVDRKVVIDADPKEDFAVDRTREQEPARRTLGDRTPGG